MRGRERDERILYNTLHDSKQNSSILAFGPTTTIQSIHCPTFPMAQNQVQLTWNGIQRIQKRQHTSVQIAISVSSKIDLSMEWSSVILTENSIEIKCIASDKDSPL